MNPEIKEYLSKQTELLAFDRSVSPVEAERRAGLFLSVCAKITDWKHMLSEGKIEAVTMNAVIYSEQLSLCTGKTVTENKVSVEANPKYTGAREELECCENDISYLRSMYDVMNNAHIFYRMLAKAE